MKRQQFKAALALALSPSAILPAYLSPMMSQFEGYANHSRRIWTTTEQVASLIRGQCVTMSGQILTDELAEIEKVSKRFDIVG